MPPSPTGPVAPPARPARAWKARSSSLALNRGDGLQWPGSVRGGRSLPRPDSAPRSYDLWMTRAIVASATAALEYGRYRAAEEILRDAAEKGDLDAARRLCLMLSLMPDEQDPLGIQSIDLETIDPGIEPESMIWLRRVLAEYPDDVTPLLLFASVSARRGWEMKRRDAGRSVLYGLSEEERLQVATALLEQAESSYAKVLATEPGHAAAVAGLAAARIDPLDRRAVERVVKAGFSPYDFLVLHVSVPVTNSGDTMDQYVVGGDPAQLRWVGATTMDGVAYETDFDVSVHVFRHGAQVDQICLWPPSGDRDGSSCCGGEGRQFFDWSLVEWPAGVGGNPLPTGHPVSLFGEIYFWGHNLDDPFG
jgi:hypothetical protein